MQKQEYRFTWQTIVGSILLLLMVITIFFPRFSLSSECYINSAVEANKNAYYRDSNLSEAKDIADSYKSDSEGRKALVENYNKIIASSVRDDSVSGLFFARWLLNVDADTDIPVMHLEEKSDISGIIPALRLWGILIYLPFLSAMILMIFLLVKRRPFAPVLLITSVVSLTSEIIAYFVIPGMIWNGIKSHLVGFELVSKEVLEQGDVGEKFIRSVLQGSSGFVWIIVSVLSVIIMIMSIVYLVGNRKSPSQEIDYDQVFKQTPEVWNKTSSMERSIQIPSVGHLRGLSGMYAGQELEIHPGEEIILGRDPMYSMLVFDNPRVSRKHCGIRYDAATGCYQAIDYSTSGTVLSDGTILTTSGYTSLMPGTVISIGETESFLVV